MYRETPSSLLVTLINGHVVALRTEDGTIAWQRRREHAAYLLVDGDRVIVVDGSEVECLTCATGESEWRVSTGLRSIGLCAALVTPSTYCVSIGGAVACITKDGALAWTNPLPGTGYGAPTLAMPHARSASRVPDDS